MHKIGIISDTHGMLRPEAVRALKDCELILHGGDINTKKILDELEQIAPVHAVRGNNDKEWAEYLPESLTLNICGVQIFMVHNRKFIPRDLTGTRLVVYGHSHKYEEKISEGIYYLNPGSCGPKRFHLETTLAILYIKDNGNFHIKKVLISQPEQTVQSSTGRTIPANIGSIIPPIMREIETGRTVKQIAKKHHISEELSEQITRMYLTHPGVDVEGILRRLGL